MRLVALTGYGELEDRDRTADAGFDLHLLKPIHPDRLLQALVDLAGGDANSAAAPPPPSVEPGHRPAVPPTVRRVSKGVRSVAAEPKATHVGGPGPSSLARYSGRGRGEGDFDHQVLG